MSSVAVPAPDEASNNAASVEIGTLAPDAPPEVVDQLVVLFQSPVPPVTQYLLAIFTPEFLQFAEGLGR